MAIIKKFRIKSFKKQKPLVSLKKVSLSFGKRQILDDINFDVNPGQVLGLLGPNGVGKSTIFNLITGLVKPAYGSIFFYGTNQPVGAGMLVCPGNPYLLPDPLLWPSG